ncbi:uncharacterized protein LOC135478254 [Liolophura sinensis]|uniref:uncharacterized protein LOC135478254 n=1 Tax=Liolophura sinensis TaxID=3198878 RepID=UPI00315923F4
MKLTPLLFLAAVLMCVHVNEGRLILKVSNILRPSSGGTSWAEKLQKWMDARRQFASVNNALAETTGDEDAKDPAEEEDELPKNVDVEDDVDEDSADDKETRRRKWLVYVRLRGGHTCSSGLLSALLKKVKTHSQQMWVAMKQNQNPERENTEVKLPIGEAPPENTGGKEQIGEAPLRAPLEAPVAEPASVMTTEGQIM